MKTLFISLLLLLFLASCHQNSSDRSAFEVAGYDGMAPVEKMAVEEAATGPGEAKPEEVVDKQKIIKDGNMGLRVKDLAKAKARVDTLVVKMGGYYANESLNNSDYETTYNLRIRVPASKFEPLIAAVESGGGEVQYKNVNARDVTEEFIDLESRLANKRSYLERYKELLSRATSVKDILEIEDKARILEEEIESVEGRLKYLSDQVAYSSLDLQITQPKDYKYTPAHRDSFTERLKQSVTRGWYGFVDFLLYFIKLWPFVLLLALLVPLWRRWRRR